MLLGREPELSPFPLSNYEFARLTALAVVVVRARDQRRPDDGPSFLLFYFASHVQRAY